MFNIYLLIYVVFCLALVGVGCYQFVKVEMLIGAGMYGVGAIVLFIMFGLKWFVTENSLLSQTPVKWPPVINTCPDYLTYYETTLSGTSTQKVCVDTLGISPTLIKFNPKESNNPPGCYFSLQTTTTDPKKELCERAMQYGLTWEGITNSESCIVGTTESPTPNLPK